MLFELQIIEMKLFTKAKMGEWSVLLANDTRKKVNGITRNLY